MKTVPRLHVVTDATLAPHLGHLELASLAVAGGADCVQLREKRPWTTRTLLDVAVPIAQACAAANALAIIDDRVDVAFAAGAGAHIGRDDIDAATARRILGPKALLGGTANSYAEAARVWQTEVDYLGVGPIFGTTSKAQPAPTMGLETLARIARDCPKPVIAIGGIRAERIGKVIAAGAHGVAVLSEVVSADDPTAATRACKDAISAALAEAP